MLDPSGPVSVEGAKRFKAATLSAGASCLIIATLSGSAVASIVGGVIIFVFFMVLR